jgi:hypothetical protein
MCTFHCHRVYFPKFNTRTSCHHRVYST